MAASYRAMRGTDLQKIGHDLTWVLAELDAARQEVAALRAQLDQQSEIMRDLGGQAREAEQAAYDAWQAGR